MNRLISILVTICFLLNTAISDYAMALAPNLVLDDMMDGTPHAKNVELAEMELAMDLEAIDRGGIAPLDGVTDAALIKAAYAKYDAFKRQRFQIPQQPIIPYSSELTVTKLSPHVFRISVSVQRQGKDKEYYNLLFSTIRRSKNEPFPIIACTNEELDKVAAGISVQDRLPERKIPAAPAGAMSGRIQEGPAEKLAADILDAVRDKKTPVQIEKMLKSVHSENLLKAARRVIAELWLTGKREFVSITPSELLGLFDERAAEIKAPAAPSGAMSGTAANDIERAITDIFDREPKRITLTFIPEIRKMQEEIIALDERRLEKGLKLGTCAGFVVCTARLFRNGDARSVIVFFEKTIALVRKDKALGRRILDDESFLRLYAMARLMDKESVQRAANARQDVVSYYFKKMRQETGFRIQPAVDLKGMERFMNPVIGAIRYLIDGYAKEGRFDRALELTDNLIMAQQATRVWSAENNDSDIAEICDGGMNDFLELRSGIRRMRDAMRAPAATPSAAPAGAMSGISTNAVERNTHDAIRMTQEALALLPREWRENGMDVAGVLEATRQSTDTRVEAAPAKLEHSGAYIISEKLAFGYSEERMSDHEIVDNPGIAALLPKLARIIASTGERIAVVAANDTERAMIKELNNGKPENECILSGDSAIDISTNRAMKGRAILYLKIKAEEPVNVNGIKTLTVIAEQIIRMLGKLVNIVDEQKLRNMIESGHIVRRAA